MIQTIKHRFTYAPLYQGEYGTLRAAVEAAVKAGASLEGADLGGADLGGASLEGDDLRGADLGGANLEGADLGGANLAGANLTGAYLPDGRPWIAYLSDPLAGICDEPAARERAIAAWGKHSWTDCPMAAGLQVSGIEGVAADKRRDVAAFVALFDALLLPQPGLAST
jgi:Pentapeptide repeats (8 copies)